MHLTMNSTKHIVICDSLLWKLSLIISNCSIPVAIARTVQKVHIYVFFILKCKKYYHSHIQEQSNSFT
jgi:hypothetical protein